MILRRVAATSLATLFLAGLVPASVLATDPPTASAATVTTTEDHLKVVTLSATDPDGGTITDFTVQTGPSDGSLGSVSSPDCTPGPACTATVTYTPDADSNGTDQFTFTATDSDAEESATATAHINITAVNDAPTFTNGGDVSVLEDSGSYSAGWATGISKGAADEGSDVLHFDVVPDDTSLFSIQPSISASGNLTFTPKANVNDQTDINVTLTDDGGTANGGDDTSATKVFTLTITPVNDPPSFTKGSNQSDLEDAGSQSVSGWATAISEGPANESAQTVSFQISSNSNPSLFSAGPAVSAAGALSYTPAANANGSATIGVEAKDNGGTADGGDDTSAAQTFAISVTAVNDAPSFTIGADQAVDEDAGAQAISGWATDLSAGPADESTQTLSFGITSNSNPSLFAVLPAVAPNGTLTYTPADDANGTATIGVRILDSGGTLNGGDNNSNSQTFSIEVPAVNDPPTFTNGPDVSVDEDSGAYSHTWATSISKGASNEGSDVLTFSVVADDPSLFAAGPSISATGTLTFTPAANANGSTDVDVTLSDDGGGADTSGTQTFTITIDSVNDAPSFTKGANESVSEDAGLQTVSDWATGISKGPANESGQDLTFVVTPTNGSLFAVAPAIADDGTLTYTPAADANGTSTVSVKLTDDGGIVNGGDDESATQTFTITVTAVNDVPSFTKGPDESTPEQTVSPAVLQTVANWATDISSGPADESGDVLSFEIMSNDNPGLFATQPAVAADGTLTFKPVVHGTGIATITVRIHDDGGTLDGGVDTSATQSFTIDVSGTNDPPIASNDGATARLAGPTTINVLANDSGGPGEPADQVKITSVAEGSRGIVTIAGDGQSLTYDPIGCSTGSDQFKYTIKDTGGTGLAATATVFVTISSPSAYPAADGPRPAFVTGSTIGSTTPVKLSWCGLTSGTTMKAWKLDQSRNGGGYTTAVASTTATSNTRSLAVSPTSYQFRARITDKKNHTAFGTGPKFKIVRTQDTSTSIAYSSGWSKSSKGSPSGGSSHATTGKSKTATMTFTGRGFAIVGTLGKGHGSFSVYVDGAKVTAISTKSKKTHDRRVLYARTTANGTHTIKVVTSGNGRVDLDAILTFIAG